MSKLYDIIENGAVAYGNLLVKGYNWSFGGTKLDLANEMLTVAPILESVGFLNWSPLSCAIITPLYLFLSHNAQLRNKKDYKLQKEAIEKNAISPEFERAKSFMVGQSVLWNSIGLIRTIPIPGKGYFTEDKYPTELVLASGHVMRGSSFLVMLADDLPPRKNCVSRGIDKLLEFNSSYVPKTQIA